MLEVDHQAQFASRDAKPLFDSSLDILVARMIGIVCAGSLELLGVLLSLPLVHDLAACRLASILLFRWSMLGIRWTIGDVSHRGFEALRLSIWGAWRLFGAEADYWVSVNTVSVARARELVGPVPGAVTWGTADACLPAWLRARFLDAGLAEGVAWKLAPLRCFTDRRELSLDNDVILWDMPPALAAWLADEHPERCLLAEDVVPSFGQFTALCGPRALNSGIRGLPGGFALGERLRAVLDEHPAILVSELDEQGLQAAALSHATGPHVISVKDVTICSPFPPHLPHLGRCGAHFVGLNARRLGWEFYGEPAGRVRARHWERHRRELYQRVGITPAPLTISKHGGYE